MSGSWRSSPSASAPSSRGVSGNPIRRGRAYRACDGEVGRTRAGRRGRARGRRGRRGGGHEADRRRRAGLHDLARRRAGAVGDAARPRARSTSRSTIAATSTTSICAAPGVDVSTGVEEVGQRTFTVTLRDGNYTFVCDPHPGRWPARSRSAPAARRPRRRPPSPPPTTTTPSPTRPAASAPVGSTLNLTVGPGFTISLRTRAGQKVTVLRPGSYTVVARDRSSAHNARLRGRRRLEGDRRRLRRDEDLARHAPERHARHPVRPAQGEHARDRPRRVADALDRQRAHR